MNLRSNARPSESGSISTVLPRSLVDRAARFHWGVGGGQGLYCVPERGAFVGGADPRRDGYAMGW